MAGILWIKLVTRCMIELSGDPSKLCNAFLLYFTQSFRILVLPCRAYFSIATVGGSANMAAVKLGPKKRVAT